MKSYARNVMTIKNDNRALIFKYIRPAPISRAAIAKQTGMSKSSVTTITNALIEEGQLVEIGAAESSVGRHPILLDIVPDYRYAIGISLHRKYSYICVTDLKSNVLSYANYNTGNWNDPYEMLNFFAEEIIKYLEQLSIPLSKCIGIGISSPGPIDYVTGTVLNPPNFEMFHNVPVCEYFEKKFGLPVLIENNAVLYAMQENILEPQKDHKNYIYVAISDGIGSALMIDDRIHRGSAGISGEIGHTSIHADGISCSCGNVGCLECYITMKALKKKFGFESYERMVDDAYLGDSAAMDVIEYIAKELSCALVNTINLLELDAVILYGEFNYRPDMLRNMLEERINGMSMISRTHKIDVKLSRLSPDLVRASACAAIINKHFEQTL